MVRQYWFLLCLHAIIEYFMNKTSVVYLYVVSRHKNQVDKASVIFCGKLLSSDPFSCFVGLDPNNQYHSLIWCLFAAILCPTALYSSTHCHKWSVVPCVCHWHLYSFEQTVCSLLYYICARILLVTSQKILIVVHMLCSDSQNCLLLADYLLSYLPKVVLWFQI